jgi:hypothetical protein
MIWKRTLRTPQSERFIGIRDGTDAVAIDLHYLPDGTVAGTVTLLASANIADDAVPALLSAFDDDFLPGVDLGSGNLTFTVIRGEIAGNFEAGAQVDSNSKIER